MNNKTTSAKVEILFSDPGSNYDETPLAGFSKVLVNGTDVGYIAEGGLDVDFSDPYEAVRVSLVLLPSAVVFRHEKA